MVTLAPGCELTIGRATPSDVQLSDPSLSRMHARVRREGNAVTIVDLGSRNGVFVAGRPVEDAVLRAGDTAVLGSITLSIQVAPAREPMESSPRQPPSPNTALIWKSPAMLELQSVVRRVASRGGPSLCCCWGPRQAVRRGELRGASASP